MSTLMGQIKPRLMTQSQARKDLASNETDIILAVYRQVLSASETDPPADPDTGDAYIVAATATGVWAGHEDEIAYWFNGAWRFLPPLETVQIGVVDRSPGPYVEYDPDGSPPGWEALSIGEVNTTFAGLTDTPNSYTDQAGKIVRVKGDETGLEFVDEASGVPGSFTTLTVSGNTTLGDNAAEDTVTVLALPTLEIDGNLVNGGWTVDYYSSTAAQGGQITGRRAAGTKASPSAVASGTTLVSYVGRGYDGSAFSGARAGMYLLTAEAWDGSSHGTRLRFQTTPVGSTSPSNAVSIEPDNAVLINTTTNNGVDKLQVNGSVSASGKVKLTTSDELVTAHGNMGATETFDASVSNVHSGTLDANCTFTLSNPSSSGRQTCLYLYITQDGTGSRTITWPGSAVGEGGGAVPAGSTAAGATDLWVCTTIDGGTSWYVALAIKGS